MQIFGSHQERLGLVDRKIGLGSRRALFLDRDGVLNVDTHFPRHSSEIVWIPEAIEVAKWAELHGFRLIVITNQSGIDRGFFSEAEFKELMFWMHDTLLDRGLTLTACYFSPSVPGAVLQDGTFRRKPDPDMITAALEDFSIDSEESVFIGDRHSDAEAARSAKIGQVFLVQAAEITSSSKDPSTHSLLRRQDWSTLFRVLVESHSCDAFCSAVEARVS